jgi:DNA repair protein SbcD/Mre11
MRFIHTADWHLGRVMHGFSLIEDQAHALEHLVDVVRDTRPDVFLVCGDVYDRSVPPKEAVELLNDFLSRLVLDLRVPVAVIAGNHDSPSRLEFAARVLAGQGLHVCGSVSPDPPEICAQDQWGRVRFYALPYAEPSSVRERLGSDACQDHESAMRAMTERVRLAHPEGERSILLAHAFVRGGVVTESERPLSVGGTEQVAAACFDGFNYVALGHLHRAQSADGSCLHYAGSLLKYSFSEADHAKSVNLVEIDAVGTCRVERIPISPRRDVRRVRGHLKEILTGPRPGENREDYLMVTLLDTGAILDVMGKLREVYPHVMHVERPGLEFSGSGAVSRPDHRTLNDAQLFADFFRQVTGCELTTEEIAAYECIANELRQEEREAVSL